MNNDFSISMLLTLLVSFIGFALWLAVFLMGWGIKWEAYFFGVMFGGIASAVPIFLIQAITRKADAKEGQEP